MPSIGVLLVAAMPVELRWIGPRNDLRWIKSAAGPGARLVRQGMTEVQISDVDAVVSVGICGAIDPMLKLGQVIVATEVNGSPCLLPSAQLASFRTGPVASVNYVASRADKQRLLSTGAIAVEMEAAEVQGHARTWGKPFYCVKAVSDTAEEEFSLDLNASRDEMGSFRIRHILYQALKKPFIGIPELFRLRKNSELAAKALGDFLAECSF